MPSPETGKAGAATGALGRSTMSGFLWLMMQSLGGRVASLVGQMVLAWFLVPADFGIVALAYSITSIAQVVASFGVDQVLLQRLRTLHRWTTPASWVALGVGLAAFTGVVVAAPIAARIYRSPQIVPIAAIAALAMPLGALSMPSSVALRARMNFRFLASYNLAEVVLTQVLTAVLAWRGFGPYSFVLPLPLLALVKAAVLQAAAPVKRRGRIRRRQLGYLISRGSSVLGSGLITSAVDQGDYMVLGLFATHAVVGLYYFAFRLAAQPMRMLAGNFTNVLLPALAQLRLEPDRQRAAAYSAAQVLSYVVVPLCFLQAALADPALSLFFGAKWRGSVPFIQILSLGLPFDAVSWVAGAMMSARGHFRRQLAYSCLFSPWFFVLAVTGAVLAKGVGVACGVSLFYFCAGPIYSSTVFGQKGRRLAELFDLYVTPYALAAAAVGAAYAASFAPLLHGSALVRLVWIGACGPLAYAGLMFAFRRSLLREILDRFGVRRRLVRFGLIRSA